MPHVESANSDLTLPAFRTLHSSDDPLAQSLVNESAYIGKTLTTNIGVPGRLSTSADYGDFYRDVLNADKETESIVRYGYCVPFLEEPPVAHNTPNNRLCRDQQSFAVAELH